MKLTPVLLGAFSGLVAVAADVEPLSPGDFVRRSFATATRIGDYIYVDGGEVSRKFDGRRPSSSGPQNDLANSTLSINIATSWAPSKAKILALDKPAPKRTGQVLWKVEDEDELWIWGGRTIREIDQDDIEKDEMWRFEADGEGGGRWSSKDPVESDELDDMYLPYRAAFASYKNTGFAFGGEAVEDSDPDVDDDDLLPVTDMVTFDFESREFHSSPMPDNSSLVGATAEYIPGVGPNGLILLLGGYRHNASTSPRPPEDAISFGNLTFLDPESKQWYSQTTTGDAPPSRMHHCSVGVKSEQDSYEIFVFGGYNPSSNETFGDLHILTLPGFHWTKVDAEAGGSRAGHACVTTNNRQMISIGGIDMDDNEPWGDEDPFPQGLGIFDMTALKWKGSYDEKAAEYHSPEPVQVFYSSWDPHSVEWSSHDTETLFVPMAFDLADKKKPPIGTIVGSTIGGVSSIVLISMLVWWLLKRKLGSEKPPEEELPVVLGTMHDQKNVSSRTTEVSSGSATPQPLELAGKQTPKPTPELGGLQAAKPTPELDVPDIKPAELVG